MPIACSGLSILGEFDGEVSTPEKSIVPADDTNPWQDYQNFSTKKYKKAPILLSDHTPFYAFDVTSADAWITHWKDTDIHFSYTVVEVYEGVL